MVSISNVITAWDSQGQLVKSQVGKLALVPGSEGLGQAPPLVPDREQSLVSETDEEQVRALAVDVDHSTESWAFGQIGIGTTSPKGNLQIYNGSEVGSSVPGFFAFVNSGSNGRNRSAWIHGNKVTYLDTFGTANYGEISTYDYGSHSGFNLALNANGGNVGIGTTSPSAALEVKGSTANLFVLKDPLDNTVFKVQKDGDVYADRSYNCGLGSGCFNAGTGADVAERIDVSETVKPGDVVEIDPANPGLYRKAQEPYSSKVAGVISTAPAITLGNNFDPRADRWTDSRPLLALAGRVPVKATAENGPIEIGDFLTTSSTPGYAMRCGDLDKCTGAILGKALEPLEEEIGVIMVQVMLR